MSERPALKPPVRQVRFTERDREICARCGATRWEHERGVRTALGLRRDHEFVAVK